MLARGVYNLQSLPASEFKSANTERAAQSRAKRGDAQRRSATLSESNSLKYPQDALHGALAAIYIQLKRPAKCETPIPD